MKEYQLLPLLFVFFVFFYAQNITALTFTASKALASKALVTNAAASTVAVGASGTVNPDNNGTAEDGKKGGKS